jgi:hypothetical protein
LFVVAEGAESAVGAGRKEERLREAKKVDKNANEERVKTTYHSPLLCTRFPDERNTQLAGGGAFLKPPQPDRIIIRCVFLP